MSEVELDKDIATQEHFKNLYATPWDFKLLAYLQEVKQLRQQLEVAEARADKAEAVIREALEQEPVAYRSLKPVPGRTGEFGSNYSTVAWPERGITHRLYAAPVPAMPIQDNVKEGFAIIEEALKKVSSGDLSQAPFPLTGDVAKAYLSGAASAYQHCLEMCNVSEVKPSC